MKRVYLIQLGVLGILLLLASKPTLGQELLPGDGQTGTGNHEVAIGPCGDTSFSDVFTCLKSRPGTIAQDGQLPLNSLGTLDVEMIALSLTPVFPVMDSMWEDVPVGQKVKFLSVWRARFIPSREDNVNQLFKANLHHGREYKIDSATVSDPTRSRVRVDTTRGGADVVWNVEVSALVEQPQYLVLEWSTGENPARKQEFTSPGNYVTFEANLKLLSPLLKVLASLDLPGPTISAK